MFPDMSQRLAGPCLLPQYIIPYPGFPPLYSRWPAVIGIINTLAVTWGARRNPPNSRKASALDAKSQIHPSADIPGHSGLRGIRERSHCTQPAANRSFMDGYPNRRRLGWARSCRVPSFPQWARSLEVLSDSVRC